MALQRKTLSGNQLIFATDLSPFHATIDGICIWVRIWGGPKYNQNILVGITSNCIQTAKIFLLRGAKRHGRKLII
jgi:hypothetical protein